MLAGGQRPDVMVRYPHMMAEDAETWTRYLTDHGSELDKVWYDVHVGTSVEVPEGSPEFLQAVADGVTRKRIDVVALRHRAYWVIEVKPLCNMTALGQALSYAKLLVREQALEGPVFPVIVCDQLDPDVSEIAGTFGVIVECNYFDAVPGGRAGVAGRG